MTKERQEALMKMLTAGDFDEKNYQDLTAEEIIILKNTAKAAKEKNIGQQKLAFFFTKREEFFYHLMLKKLQSLPEICVLFSRATNLPYVYCDPESCNDQVWIFTIEALAKKTAAEEKQANMNELVIVKLQNKDFLGFYQSLFLMGVNELLLDKGGNALEMELTTLVRQPDYSKLPPEKRPVINAELVLTCAYFAQELRTSSQSGKEMSNETKTVLKELEEEMLANFRRATFVVPVLVPEGAEKISPQDIRMPFLKMKNGDVYQPICSDLNEFKKFNKEGKLRGLNVPYEKLSSMMGAEVKGLLLNPASFHMAFPKEKI